MIEKWIDEAFEFGMFQHREEIEPFARWLYGQQIRDVIEIGAWKGGTAYLWGNLAPSRILSIDLPMGRFGGADAGLTLEACQARNRELDRRNPLFVGILGDSHDPAVYRLVDYAMRGNTDLLFIDGDHTYEGVKQDFEMYCGLVRPGGIVAFHDINDTLFHREAGVEVARLWHEIEGDKQEFSIGGDWGGIGVWRKPA